MGKDNFKEFVKKNPGLLKFVQDGSMTWQKFYEMYDMYGENSNVWNDYLNDQDNKVASLGIFDMIKNLDVDSIQTGINSMQRVLGLIQEMSSKNKETQNVSEYKPRPLYKHFED